MAPRKNVGLGETKKPRRSAIDVDEIIPPAELHRTPNSNCDLSLSRYRHGVAQHRYRRAVIPSSRWEL